MKSSLIRVAVFLYVMIVLSATMGILLSEDAVPNTREWILGITLCTLVVSFLTGYKPGWLYHWILDTKERRPR